MILLIIPPIIFISCWILFIVNWVLTMITQKKLKKALNNYTPEIRNNLKFGFSGLNNDLALESPFGIFKIIFSFGNKVKTSAFLNQFVDIDAINRSENQKIIDFKNKLVKQLSNGAKFWVIMILSVLIGVITFNISK